jgi:predicted DNA binding CopG/RHH family protein
VWFLAVKKEATEQGFILVKLKSSLRIKSKINELGNIHLYIWLGTCDLTTKNKDGTISLATQHSETSKNVFEELKKFKLLLQPYPNSRITFIEIPHYSITKWNIHAKKSPTEDRINQDQELHQQILNSNTQIQDLDSSLNVRSPLLNLHLKASKQVKRGKNKPRKQYINYQLYLDDILIHLFCF